MFLLVLDYILHVTYVTSYITDTGGVRQIETAAEVMKLKYNFITIQEDNIFFVFGDNVPQGVKHFLKEKCTSVYFKNGNSSIF